MTSNRRIHSAKSQSAMEYLVTFGWAIAIITVVLAGLFSLGVFNNNSSFTQRAHAGACVMTRQSTGLTSTVALTGECTNLQPQFVAQFNGATSLINISGNPIWLNLQSPFTISVWIKINQVGVQQNIFTETSSTAWTTNGFEFYVNPNTLRVNVFGQSSIGSTTVLAPGTWYQVAITFSPPSNFIFYVDGVPAGSGTQTTAYASSYPIYIGNQYPGSTTPFGGDMTNLQFYNGTLSAAEVLGLYTQGIGVEPVRPTNVTGWWQLNGDVNDYSGLSNKGIPSNVAFTTSWTGGYNIP